MNPRILVIDDSPDIHELVDLAFTGQSYEVLHALDATNGTPLIFAPNRRNRNTRQR